MGFYLGEDVTVYISTDDVTYGVSMSAANASISAETWSGTSAVSDFIAPPLAVADWDGSEAETGSAVPRGRAITEVAGVDSGLDKDIEELELLGRITKDKVTIRKLAEISVTRLASSAELGKIYEDGDFGIDGTGLHDGQSQNTTQSGYRIYLQLSPTTGSGEMWITGRGMKITGHKVNITPSRTVQEVITFRGELWDVDVKPFITVTQASEL